jgi:hypothetical protein
LLQILAEVHSKKMNKNVHFPRYEEENTAKCGVSVALAGEIGFSQPAPMLHRD